MNLRRIYFTMLLLSSAITLASCASLAPEVDLSKPHAKIRLSTTYDHITQFSLIDQKSCPNYSTGLVLVTMNPASDQQSGFKGYISKIEMIGSSSSPSSYIYERTIAARGQTRIFAQHQYLAIHSWQRDYVCSQGFEFSPDPAWQYDVEFLNIQSRACAIRVHRMRLLSDGTVQRMLDPTVRVIKAQRVYDMCPRVPE
jgi:hypothetical protein